MRRFQGKLQFARSRIFNPVARIADENLHRTPRARESVNAMVLPPAVIIHSLPHARLALAPRRPVTLLSAPGAALYAGCLWWQALIEAADTGNPHFLDCADAPGRAVEALKLGLPGIILNCEENLFAAVASIAQAQGAALLAAAPPALDLARRGAERKLDAWLQA
jgi:hypothetical protein